LIYVWRSKVFDHWSIYSSRLAHADAKSKDSKTRLSSARAFRPAGNSGGGPPQSKTLARDMVAVVKREASWTAPVLWRFARVAFDSLPPGLYRAANVAAGK